MLLLYDIRMCVARQCAGDRWRKYKFAFVIVEKWSKQLTWKKNRFSHHLRPLSCQRMYVVRGTCSLRMLLMLCMWIARKLSWSANHQMCLCMDWTNVTLSCFRGIRETDKHTYRAHRNREQKHSSPFARLSDKRAHINYHMDNIRSLYVRQAQLRLE